MGDIARSLHVSGRCVHIYAHRNAKMCMIIHWTVLRRFGFLHHPPILHCLKAITDYREVYAHLRMLVAHACMYYSQFFLLHCTKFGQNLSTFGG